MTLTRRCLLATGALLAIAVPARAQERRDTEILEEAAGARGPPGHGVRGRLRRDVIEAGLGETLLRDQEREHIRGLEQALGAAGRGSAKPPCRRPRWAGRCAAGPSSPAYALELEREAETAYVDAASAIGRVGLRQPARVDPGVRGAHQVALRASVGDSLLEVE